VAVIAMPVTITPTGIFLSEAASFAFGARQLATAALIRIDDAELSADDLAFMEEVELKIVDVPTMMENLSALAENMQRLADAYGHAEVARRWRGC
jgi:hypothetical protein